MHNVSTHWETLKCASDLRHLTSDNKNYMYKISVHRHRKSYEEFKNGEIFRDYVASCSKVARFSTSGYSNS